MKRTKSINLNFMRKTAVRFALKPLAAAAAASVLVACSSSEDARIYTSLENCKVSNPELSQQCEDAFQQAQAEAEKSGPKYDSQTNCETEFGQNNCVPYRTDNGHSWFIPALAGFMVGRMMDRGTFGSAPLYTSYSRNSPAYGQWTTVDGNLYGGVGRRDVRVPSGAFKPKPPVTKTMSRGGFGSKISAKSNWGGSTNRSGWGG